jgi:hypothetical protein
MVLSEPKRPKRRYTRRQPPVLEDLAWSMFSGEEINPRQNLRVTPPPLPRGGYTHGKRREPAT